MLISTLRYKMDLSKWFPLERVISSQTQFAKEQQNKFRSSVIPYNL